MKMLSLPGLTACDISERVAYSFTYNGEVLGEESNIIFRCMAKFQEIQIEGLEGVFKIPHQQCEVFSDRVKVIYTFQRVR